MSYLSIIFQVLLMQFNNGDSNPSTSKLSFEDTEIAFRHATNIDIKRAYWLFRAINNNWLVKMGLPVINMAIKIGLPVKGLIKATIFKHFCGGETIEGCHVAIKKLSLGGVGTILDYAVEGEDEEAVFDATRDEIIRTVARAACDAAVPVTVFKITGIARFGLLKKLDAKETLTATEEQEWQKAHDRVKAICNTAFKASVPVMIDAEESWIQHTIDSLAMEMMRLYNRKKAIVYNTYQFYRNDKLDLLQHDCTTAEKEGFILGAKLVRGAYMEKERKRAQEQNYPSPIQPDKAATDSDYDAALRFCVAHTAYIAIVAGTHNEESCRLLATLIDDEQVPRNNPHIYFAQLLGMSDNLSFNLANAGYNVAKYVPYGPVKAVLPYLFRRAQENTAISGQMSRELSMIVKEMKRRGLS